MAGHATLLLKSFFFFFLQQQQLLYIRSRLKKELIAGFIAPADKVKNAPLTQK